ncbi:hypothetical protein, partial [Kitasatospora sp. NPDC059571]|uniref:hypothetical protein n=1 Tax=Kitasatospora sp. NPDC059571 TaxID=3346871 RepID=UPI0036A23375
PPAPAPPPAAPRERPSHRQLAHHPGGGFTEPRYLARRGDGQVVQLSLLLHLVASAIDGVRDTAAVAELVSARFGREVSAENVDYLIEHKLRPMGITAPPGPDADPVDIPRSDLLLGLTGRRVLLRERHVRRIGRSLAWLHRPWMVAAVLTGAVALDVWLFAVHGALGPVLQVLNQPVLLLAVFGLTVASLLFHEFGHASACTYGGARPGPIGCGLYILWPSLYTDVTDVYRIGRAGRLRADLGGVYFNVVFILGLAGGYALTGHPLFLTAVLVGHIEIIEQLMPAVRLDGYFILGDLAGVPDLFGKIRPTLLSMLPGRPVRPEVAGLKRSARTVVTVWVLTMVPLLAGELGYVLWHLPRILGTALHSLSEQVAGTVAAFTDREFSAGAVGVIGIFTLLCPLVGGGYLAVRTLGRLLRAALRAVGRALRPASRRRAAPAAPAAPAAHHPSPSAPPTSAEPLPSAVRTLRRSP